MSSLHTSPALDLAGFEPFQLEQLLEAARSPVGMVILAGTCASGKSTTARALVNDFISQSNGQCRVSAIEEYPSEHSIPGATVVHTARFRLQEGGSSDAEPSSNGIRTAVVQAMKSDPDLVFLEEIRCKNTAAGAVMMAESGVKVFTTAHASSALGISFRLKALLSGPIDFDDRTVSAYVYQSLVPVVCSKCALSWETHKGGHLEPHEGEQIARFERFLSPDLLKKLAFRNHAGCDECVRGAAGRTLVAEVVVPDPEILSFLRDGNEIGALLHWHAKGGRTALQHGLSKAIRGLCDLRDIESRLDTLEALEELAVLRGHAGKLLISADPIDVAH